MATVTSAICSDAYWNDPNWAGYANQAARDAYYAHHFTSYATFEADRDGNANAGDDEVGEIVGTWAAVDTLAAGWDVVGWGAVNSLEVKCLADALHDGTWGAANTYIADVGGVGLINEDFQIYIRGVQFEGPIAADMINTVGSEDVDIDSCIFKGGTGQQSILEPDGTGTVNIFNCVMFGESDYGVYARSGTVNVYNCTITTANHATGIRDGGATTTYKDNAILNNADDINLGDTIDYNASDDDDGTNNKNGNEADAYWSTDFNDLGNGDATLASGSPLVGVGTDNPGAGLYSDDISGQARTSTWDIGAWEYVAPAAGGILQHSAVLAQRRRILGSGDNTGLPILFKKLRDWLHDTFKIQHIRRNCCWAYN